MSVYDKFKYIIIDVESDDVVIKYSFLKIKFETFFPSLHKQNNHNEHLRDLRPSDPMYNIPMYH